MKQVVFVLFWKRKKIIAKSNHHCTNKKKKKYESGGGDGRGCTAFSLLNFKTPIHLTITPFEVA